MACKPFRGNVSRVELITKTSRGAPPPFSSPNETRESVLRRVTSALLDIPGVVACHRLAEQQLRTLIDTEAQSNRNLYLPGLEIVNEGMKDVASRECFVAIAHTSKLRHPPGAILVICCGDDVVGEELWDSQTRTEASSNSNLIFLGRSLKLYRDGLERSREKSLKVCYRALRFPELENIKGVRDVISVTVNPSTHAHLSRLTGWDERDPNLGTVLIGFNIG